MGKQAVPPPEPSLLENTTVLFFALAAAGMAGAYLTKQNGMATASLTLAAAASFATLEGADALVKSSIGQSIVAGGQGAVTVILFATPAAEMTVTAKKVLGGHVVAAACALAQMAALPSALAFASKTVLVGAIIAASKAADTVHPPACAFGLLFYGASKGWYDTVGPLVGCALLIGCQQVWLGMPGPKRKRA